jgi:hypothetical protein
MQEEKDTLLIKIGDLEEILRITKHECELRVDDAK